MTNFSNLPKDVISHIVLYLNLPEILSLCLVSKKFKNSICNKYFWVRLLNRDFGIKYLNIGRAGDPKIYYQFFNRCKNKNINQQLYEAEKVLMIGTRDFLVQQKKVI